MGVVRAAVLAAGRGVRMGGGTPKTLLQIGPHAPLLFYILEGIKRAGIDDLLVVTGHRAAEVEDYVEKEWSGTAAFVRNMRYASWGNFHSVRVALDQSPGHDVLVVNSDVIVQPDVYRRTADAFGDLVLAVQKREDLDNEDMRVELSGNRILDIGKNLRMSRSHAEYAGVSLIRSEAARHFKDLSTELEWQGTTGIYYEDVYRAMLDRTTARGVAVRAGTYAEVDEPVDQEAALAVIESHLGDWGGETALSGAAGTAT